MEPTTVVSTAQGGERTAGRSGSRRRWRQGYVLASGIMALAVLLQVFLAGGGLFAEPSWWPMHRMMGMMLSLGPLVLLILGAAARLSWRTLVLTGLLFVLVGLQPVLILAPEQLEILKAFHVVNAMLIFALTALLGQQARQRLSQPLAHANEPLIS